jgi:hypothetical protein
MTRGIQLFLQKTRLFEAALIMASVLVLVLAGGTASADGYYGGHHGYYGSHVDVYIGRPAWRPWWRYPYYYTYAYVYQPVVSAPSAPETYIERSEPEAAASQAGTWYYCPESKKYYPYVQECSGGWQNVPAEPSSGPGR